MYGELIANRYQILKTLGAGGMSTVYLVEDIFQNNQKKALKTIRSEILDPKVIERFKNEFRAMSELHHPNLAEVYDFGTTENGLYFFTMEYFNGKDLRDLRGGKDDTQLADLDYKLFYSIVVQICRALEYIHSRGVIHYDVKPSNILYSLSEPLQVKLMDFGLAQKAQTQKDSSSIRGTIYFIAPEMIRRERLDLRADLYSLGVVLYRIVTGSLPFMGKNSGEVLHKHVHQEPIPPRHLDIRIPDALENIILKLLKKNPDDRFASANEVIQAINAISEKEFDLETSQTKRSYILSGRFVGRTEELFSLKGLLDDLLSSCSEKSLVLISGGAGMGKDRLLREYRIHCQLNQIDFYQGYCYQEGSLIAQPFIEILSNIVRSEYLNQHPKLLQIYSSQLKKLVPNIPHSDYDAVTEIVSLVDGVVDFLLELGALRPMVIAINNFHWADSLSVELLESVVEKKPGNILFCITYRDTDIENKWLTEALNAFEKQDYTKTIELKPFTAEEVSELISSMFGTDRPPSDFVEKLIKETNGNPLLTEEVMKSLAENDLIYHKDGILHADVDELFEVDIPQSISVLVQRKLSKMNDLSVYTLEVMAVYNKPVTLDILINIIGDMDVKNTVERLATDHLIHKDKGADTRYVIAHDGIRKYLYSNLPRKRRQHIHKLIGTVLERSNASENAEELAYHFVNAGDRAKTAQYAIRAGERAERLYANEKAVSFYTTALSILGKEHQEQRDRLTEKLGRIYENMGEFDRALSVYDEISDPGPQIIFRVAHIHILRGNFKTALNFYDDIEAEIQKDKTFEPLLARLSLHRADVYQRLGEGKTALEYCEKALEQSKENLSIKPQILNMFGIIHCRLGDYNKTIEFFQEALRLGEESANIQNAAGSYNNLGLLYATRGDYSHALDCYQRGSEIFDRVGNLHEKANLLNNLGDIYFVKGNFEDAERGWVQSLDVGQKLGVPVIIIEASYGLGRLDQVRGAYQSALARINKGIEVSKEINYVWLELMGLCYLVDVYLEVGAIEQAMEHIQSTMERAEIKGFRPISAISAYLFGRSAYLQKAFEYAEMYYNQALELYEGMTDLYYQAHILLAKSHLDYEGGKPEDAITSLTRVENIETTLGSEVIKVFRLYALGKFVEDKNAAMTSLSLASELAEELELYPVIWRIRHEMGRIYYIQENTGLALNEYKNATQLMEYLGSTLTDESLLQSYKMHDHAMQLSQDIQFLEYQISEERGKLSQQEIDKIVEGATAFRKKESRFEEILHDLFVLHQETEATVDSLERERRRFRLLFNASRAISSTLNLNDLMHKVMQMTVEITKAERACLILLDHENRWEVEMAYRMNQEVEDYEKVHVSSVAIQEMIEVGKAVHTHDAQKEGKYANDSAVVNEHITTIMCSPMRIKDRIIGALYVDNQTIEDDYMLQTLEFFQSLADQSAVAIENARLYERVEQDRLNTERLNNEITKLYEIGKALTSVLDLDDLLLMAMDKMMDITNAQRGFLMLIEESQLVFKIARDVWGKTLEEGEFRISRSIPQSVVESGKSIFINSLRGHEDSFSSIADLKLQSVICSPLKVKDKTIGVVYLDTHSVSKEFSIEDLTLMETFAGQVSVAIENARLYEEVAVKERLEQEFTIASRIQMGLLPKTVPEIDGINVHGVMVPAKEVGGDYYDFISTDHPDELYICVGDVSGKGVPAGLVMAMARTLLRPLVQTHNSTKDVLVEVNALLYPDMEDTRFLTMLLLRWNHEKQILEYTGAGQEHLLIYRTATKKCEMIRAKGLMLGIIDDVSPYLIEETLDLSPGDTVLLYTDGVTELRDEEDTMFGLEYLQRLVEKYGHLSPSILTNKILTELRLFRGRSEPFDDITLLAIQRTNS